MRVYKNVVAKWVIAPNTIIEGSEFLSEIYLLLLNLSKISKLSVELINSKFGFNKEISTFLLESLYSKGLIKESNEQVKYELDEPGKEALVAKKIAIIEKTNLRLLLVDEPTFILNNYWYIPNATIYDEKIIDPNLKGKILTRRDLCGLDKNIISFTSDLEIISQQNSVLSMNFTGDFPEIFLVEVPPQSKFKISISEKDPIVANLYNEISTIFQQLEEFVKKRLTTIFYDLSLEPEIELSTENYYEVNLTTNRSDIIEEMLEFDHWLTDLRNSENSVVELKIEIFNGWYIWVKVKLNSENEFIRYMLFREFVFNNEALYKELVLSDNFMDDLEKALEDFYHETDYVSNTLDKEKISQVFWLQERSKIFVSKLYEEEVLNE